MNNIKSVTLIYDVLTTPPKKDCYKLELLNNTDSIFVPLDEANTDYQAIQEWIADGGTVIDNGGSE